MSLDAAYRVFFDVVLSIQGVLFFLCMIRSIIGPSVPDRIVAVNMVGTNAIALIAMLAVRLIESYLADIGLIYAMVSFLAVVLLTKVYMGAYRERKIREQEQAQKEEEKREEAEL